ncbi:MAG: cytochrome c [Parvibaculaceae bacterium]
MLARMIWAMLAVVSLLSTTAFAADATLRLSIHGKPVAQLSGAEIARKVPATRITVWEPHEDKNVTYEGFDAGKLFTAIYGERWKESDEVLFTCVDGYQPVLAMERFARHRAYLVYRRLDQETFTVQNRFENRKDVPLAPFYLVWDNLRSQELRADGANGWPYQVTGVDLVTFADRFPGLSPPATASDQARKGFVAFRENCMACHTINGEGGSKAPELNYPVSVTEYLSPDWIRRWVMDPRAVRYNATMPGFAAHPDAERLIDDVLAYLKTMARHKRKPE